jgi:hypothetical protein
MNDDIAKRRVRYGTVVAITLQAPQFDPLKFLICKPGKMTEKYSMMRA